MRSISGLRAWMTRELERRSATMSGAWSAGLGVRSAPGGRTCGGAPGPAGSGGTFKPKVAAAVRRRPVANIWFRSTDSSWASAFLMGMIWSSSRATFTSASFRISRRRRILAVVSVIMMRLVSRWRLTAPCPATNGRSRLTASWALMYLRVTIWVTNSSLARDGSPRCPPPS
jgi:hypothetical protein